CYLLTHSQPCRLTAEFDRKDPGGVAAGPAQALDITGADRVGNLHEHDGHRAGCLQQRTHADTAGGQDHVRRERDQFRDISAVVSLVQIPAMLDLHVAADRPAQLLQTLQERRAACWRNGFPRRLAHEHADAPHALPLLRPRRERPPNRRAAEQRDDIAAVHSITSSARASSVGGTSRPSILAVAKLMTSSNLLACMIGKSAGFAPLSMRPA